MAKDENKQSEENIELKSTFQLTTTIYRSQSADMPEYYSTEHFFYIEKKDIDRIEKEFSCYTKNKNNSIHVIREILMIVCGAFFGNFISGFVAQNWLPDWRGWLCFVISPLVSIFSITMYFVLGSKDKEKEVKLAEVVKEHLLMPQGRIKENENE